MTDNVSPIAPTNTGSASSSPMALLRAMRPHHWLKNTLVFVPILLAYKSLTAAQLGYGLVAFVALSLIASAIYLLNDLIDIESDRKHPVKCRRPLASGELAPLVAQVASPLLVLMAFAVCFLLPQPGIFAAVLASYLVTALAYVFFLKRKLLVDVVALAGLHTLRILAGTFAAMVEFSFWLSAFAMFLFFSLALVKRYSELKASASETGLRARGRGYQADDLDILSQLGTASGLISVLILALYIDSAAVRAKYAYPELIWLVCPIVLYVVARIWVLAHRGHVADDPLVFIMTDWRSHIMAVLTAGIMFVAM
jgi:4-hydroxybenzoate polyprenyltransferase